MNKTLRYVASLTVLLATGAAVNAANYDWIGGASSAWTNGANWSPVPPTYPVAGDTVLFGVNQAVSTATIDLGTGSRVVGTNTVNNSVNNSSLRFGELGGINNYTLTNGQISLGNTVYGFLVGTNVTLNVKADISQTGSTYVDWGLDPNTTVNIASNVNQSGNTIIYVRGGTSVFNVNSPNFQGTYLSIDGGGLTYNINASHSVANNGWFFGGGLPGGESKIVVRNGATVSHNTRVYAGAPGTANPAYIHSTARLVIGDASTTGQMTLGTAAFFRFGYQGGTTGILDVVNGQFDMMQSGSAGVVLPTIAFNNANNADTLAEINVYTNGVLNTRVTFEQGAAGAGRINFRGGTLQANSALVAAQANNLLKSGLPVNVYDGGAVIDNNAKDITINAGLLNPGGSTGGLSLVGSGSTTLNGANTFTGPTLVKAGALILDSGFSTLSSITVSNGAALRFKSGFLGSNPNVTVADGGLVGSALTTAGTAMTVNSLTLGNTTTGAVFNVQFGAGVNDSITVSGGGLTINGGRINLYAEGSTTAFTAQGTYTLFNYSGGLSGNVTNLVVNNPSTGLAYTFADTGSAITLTIALDTSINQWGVDADGNWSASGNWTLSAVPNGVDDIAIFGPAIFAPRTVNSDSAHTVGKIELSSVNAYTVSGAGVISLDSSSNALVTATTGSHTISAPIALAAEAQFGANSGETLTLGGSISGGSDLVVTNNLGTVAILGTASAPVTVASGTVNVSGGGQVTQPLTLLGGATYIDSEANLGPNPGSPSPTQLLLDGGSLLSTGDATIDDANRGITLGTNGGGLGTAAGGYTLTVAKAITGTGGLTKTGAGDGTLVLTAANTYSGDTVVAQGELSVGNGGTTGTLGGTNVTIVNDSRLTLNRGDLTSFATDIVVGSGGARVRNSGANTVTLGKIDWGNSALRFETLNAGLVVVGDDVSNINILRKSSGNTLTLSGALTDLATGGRMEVEEGTLAFASGANWNIPGNVFTIRVGTVGFIGSTALVISNGASLTMNGFATGYVNGSQGTSVTIDGANVNLLGTGVAVQLHTTGTAGLSDNLTVDNGGTLNVVSPSSVVSIGYRGDSSFTINNGTVSVNRIGFGRVESSSALAASGNCDITLNAGSLNISNQFELMRDTSATPLRVNTVNLNGGTLRTVAMNCTSPNAAIAFNFNGGTLVALGNALTGSGTLSDFMSGVDIATVGFAGAFIDSGGYDMTITQDLQDGGGALTKLGNGTLYLNGTNAYTGLTAVGAGKLGGTGSVAGSVTVASGAGLAPGASVGTFTIGGNLTMANSTIAVELNKGLAQSNDVVNVTGSINYGTSTMVVTNLGATPLAPGDTFPIFKPGGSGSVSVVSPAGTTMSFNTATGVLTVNSVVAPNPGTLGYSVSGNVITFGWTNTAAKLQYQTNALSVGLGTNWVAYPVTNNPVSVTNDGTVPASFFRLSVP